MVSRRPPAVNPAKRGRVLKSLFAERFGSEFPESEYAGVSQRAISAKIRTILATDGVVPASDEVKARVVELAQTLGKTIVPNQDPPAATGSSGSWSAS